MEMGGKIKGEIKRSRDKEIERVKECEIGKFGKIKR